jgi:hypothetical protein
MSGASTSCYLTEAEQTALLYEVLDEETVSEYSSDSDSDIDPDYTQFVTPGTCAISDSDTDETQEVNAHVPPVGVSTQFVWNDIDTFPASQETFYGVSGPQFDTDELDVVSAFENIFGISLV